MVYLCGVLTIFLSLAWLITVKCNFPIFFCSRPVDEEIVLERENALWNAAMEYRKVHNMVISYFLHWYFINIYTVYSYTH
jgi:hypothetical protein